jgi:alkyldihydroxyacetonephosphate synthase
MTKIADALRKALGSDRVADDAATRQAHGVDYWFLAHLRAYQGRGGAGPVCVVSPRSTAEVATAVRTAQQHGTAIVPYGGGSGVLGGAVPPDGAIAIDLRAMNELLALDEIALFARVQAGMMGDVHEATIRDRGYTTGHYPQSIARATMGGLVATRSAGQFSTKYGNIEDLLLGLEAVLPSGNVIRLDPFPRSATGPALQEIFLGSEGALGIITEVTVKVFPLPERREVASLAFTSIADGVEAIRRIVRPGWRPAVVRLYDQLETARHFSAHNAPADSCMLLVVCEGPAALATAEMQACRDVANAMGAIDAGTAPVEHWLGHRNEVPHGTSSSRTASSSTRSKSPPRGIASPSCTTTSSRDCSAFPASSTPAPTAPTATRKVRTSTSPSRSVPTTTPTPRNPTSKPGAK